MRPRASARADRRRPSRLTATVVTVGMTAAATTGLGATAAADRGGCRAPEGASAVHRSQTVVVYGRARTPTTATYWGCLRSNGRRTMLPGSHTGRRALSSFRSAGRHLAFFVEEIDGRSMTGAVGVRVFDLGAGKAERGIALDISPGTPDRVRLRSLVLTARGTAAWREVGRVDRVAARDLRGRRRILDTGPRGSIRDLVLRRGAIARWRSDGKIRRRRINQLGRTVTACGCGCGCGGCGPP